ncbi:MAG: Orotidine 5'-phosphate decarboxylase [Ignavibacteria bacterium]|nr:Orotidine 5'-phosphate decarboxylase [Ignavibacteria bacterium]
MAYTGKLKKIISRNKSILVIGLDTDLNKIPNIFLKYKNPVSEFNKAVIECTKDVAAGYKLNLAFYEYLEEQGISAMRDTVKSIPEDMIKICDSKRGDIENTAEMYAKTYFDKYNFDSITVSPYMGRDALVPFLKRNDKCVYVLALTSNKSNSDLQLLKSGGKFLYESVIEFSLSMSADNNVGFVFGANHTEEILKFTSLNPEVPLLIPGIGAQKNDIGMLMKSIKSETAVINSSRAVIYSAPKDCSEKEFFEKIRESAVEFNKEIDSCKNSV